MNRQPSEVIATHLFGRNDPAFEKVLAVAKDTFERIVTRYPDRDELRFELWLGD